MKVLPVVHHIESALTREQVALALGQGADGVFLISHFGDDRTLRTLAAELVACYGAERIGVNFLSKSFSRAFTDAVETGAGMLWTDTPQIASTGYGEETESVCRTIETMTRAGRPVPLVFGSVAFKYQPNEPNPADAASICADLGFIATTSGVATGSAPDFTKIELMRRALGERPLAIASGLSAENLPSFRDLITHALVATGISKDEHRIELDKLVRFLAVARQSALPLTSHELSLPRRDPGATMHVAGETVAGDRTRTLPSS